MGRKKINIAPITHSKNRLVTFNKRKVGLMKKAMELSILCECDIALIVLPKERDVLYQYSSQQNLDDVLNEYYAYSGPAEVLTNKELNKLNPGKASSFRPVMRQPKMSMRPVMQQLTNNGDVEQTMKKRKAGSNTVKAIPAKQIHSNKAPAVTPFLPQINIAQQTQQQQQQMITIGDQVVVTAAQLAHLNPQTIANIQQIAQLLDKGLLNNGKVVGGPTPANVQASYVKQAEPVPSPQYNNQYSHMLQQHSNANVMAPLYSPHTVHPAVKYNPQRSALNYMQSPHVQQQAVQAVTTGRSLSHDAVGAVHSASDIRTLHLSEPQTAPPAHDSSAQNGYTSPLMRPSSVLDGVKRHRSSSRASHSTIKHEDVTDVYDTSKLQSSHTPPYQSPAPEQPKTNQTVSTLSQRAPFKVSLSIPDGNQGDGSVSQAVSLADASHLNDVTTTSNNQAVTSQQPQPMYNMPYSALVSPQFTGGGNMFGQTPYMQMPVYSAGMNDQYSNGVYAPMRTPAMPYAAMTPLYTQQSMVYAATPEQQSSINRVLNHVSNGNDYGTLPMTPTMGSSQQQQ